ncbi:MAG TPA: DUF6029 family protein, partial [Bacteroidia bacterium]|nr:DUF6029 family protein [Bacteroidia bacterium]
LRVDNMSYRSDRNAALTALSINYIPALARQHTYSLAAYYPFSSQPNGEVNWQTEIAYKVKKGSKLGGKYGTDLTLNYAAAFALDTNNLNDATTSRMGYSSNWWPIGDSLFFQDINFEVARKLNKNWKFTALYIHEIYDKNIMEGKTNYPYIKTDVTVADITTRLGDHFSLHSIGEHMLVEKGHTLNAAGNDSTFTVDHGNWVALTEELSMGEHFYFAIIDQYNYGNPNPDARVHYFKVQAGYNRQTSSISLGYGKQREGIFCVGGVCRQVPASNGFTLTITSSF